MTSPALTISSTARSTESTFIAIGIPNDVQGPFRDHGRHPQALAYQPTYITGCGCRARLTKGLAGCTYDGMRNR